MPWWVFLTGALVFLMAEHLLACGYKRLAFIGAPPEIDRRAHERHQGFVGCLRQHKREYHRHVILQEHSVSVSAGKTGITMLLAQFPDADAVITLTELILGHPPRCWFEPACH